MNWVKGSVAYNGGKTRECQICSEDISSVIWERKYICQCCYIQIRRVSKSLQGLERKRRRATSEELPSHKIDEINTRIENLIKEKDSIINNKSF